MVLNGKTPDVVPSLMECAMDVTCLVGLLPQPTGSPIIDGIRMAEFYDNSCVSVGVGPGSETISRNSDHHTYRYETGAVWRESYVPVFCREALQYPINDISDINGFTMPNAADPRHYKGMKELVSAWKDAGYFVQGDTWGAWQSIYYLLTSFENILIWMAVEPEAAHRLFDLTAGYSIQAAKGMLDAGVDAIFVPSDLGSGQGLLFSKEMFYEYVFPWLKKLADLCHSHGAILHLHSHGHIEDLMDGIVESGVDLLNPVGPSDHNDLGMFKQKWGNKITFMGGISTTIAQMSIEEMEAHVSEVMRIGCRGGRFIPRTESGIPFMPAERVLAYIEILKKYRQMHGAASGVDRTR